MPMNAPHPEPEDLEGLEALGRAISAARKRRRLTQLELARAVGLSRQTIAGLEAGNISDIGIRKVMRVLEHLELSLVTRPAGHPVTLEDLLRERAQADKRGDR